ncbi:MAG: helix-turn-helix transcriptional regulator [Bacteroidales bacterium]|nr:helix-turn-helix transcriptional regulator [Bacteroidales bacterium]
MANIKQFLIDNNMRQVELARFLGITEGSVSKMAKGITRPSGENLRKMMDNDKGWDTSSLLLEPGRTMERSDLKEENRRLRKEVDRLLSIIERLTDPSLNRHFNTTSQE